MPNLNRWRGYWYNAAYILVAILIFVVTGILIAYEFFKLAFLGFFSLVSEFGIYTFRGLRRRLGNLIVYIWQFLIGPTDAAIHFILDILQRDRMVWEFASSLFRLFRRRDTQPESTRDNIATGQPENVASAPEYDAESASSISNQDIESRSQTIRRFIDAEPTRSLYPPYRMVTWAWPARNEQHRNPSRFNFQLSFPFILAPDFDMEENTEERNRNRTSNGSEYSSPDGISTSPTPVPGPSGLQWKKGGEST